MKFIIKTALLFFVIAAFFTACDKVDDLPFYAKGKAPVLTASSLAIAPAPADSNNTALTLSWSHPDYATDTARIKYIVQIDTAGGNFSNPASKQVSGVSSISFTAKELNNIALGYGGTFGVAKNLQARLLSSYANNNERYESNTLAITMTPYKVPPKVALPASGKLFIVGDATQGGWGNPVPVPSQELVRVDETTFGGVFYLNGGKEFLILPVNGSWAEKYSVANKTVADLNAGGEFGLNLSDNFPGPAATGWYKITLDFQAGKFTVVPYTGTFPEKLFIVGDATAGGWDNPVPVPAQELTRINSSQFQITLPLVGGKEYLLLPVNGSWGHKYSVADNSTEGLAAGGAFGYDLSDNFPGPAESGTYTILVNFYSNTFSVTKQ
jgi:hypothetical protein